MAGPTCRATFIVQLKDTQNSTWQGSVVWAEKNISKPFRSALELIRLMDSAIAETDGNTPDGTHPEEKVTVMK